MSQWRQREWQIRVAKDSTCIDTWMDELIVNSLSWMAPAGGEYFSAAVSVRRQSADGILRSANIISNNIIEWLIIYFLTLHMYISTATDHNPGCRGTIWHVNVVYFSLLSFMYVHTWHCVRSYWETQKLRKASQSFCFCHITKLNKAVNFSDITVF